MDYRRTAKGRKRSWYGAKRYVKHALAWPGVHLVTRVIAKAAGQNRAGRLPAPARLKEVRGTAHGESFVMLRPDICVVAKELYWGKGVRPRPEDALAVEVFAILATESRVVLDVGAYTGLFTLVAGKVNLQTRLHAFEIVPDVFEWLTKNCIRNNIFDRCHLHALGLGTPDTTVRVPSTSSDSALPSFYSTDLVFEDGVLVPIESLDSQISLITSGPVLIKIDVEGTENQILRHGQEFLARFEPDILCEVLHGSANGLELEALLGSDYRYYLVTATHLQEQTSVEPNEQYRDWLFSKRDQVQLGSLGIPTSVDHERIRQS